MSNTFLNYAHFTLEIPSNQSADGNATVRDDFYRVIGIHSLICIIISFASTFFVLISLCVKGVKRYSDTNQIKSSSISEDVQLLHSSKPEISSIYPTLYSNLTHFCIFCLILSDFLFECTYLPTVSIRLYYSNYDVTSNYPAQVTQTFFGELAETFFQAAGIWSLLIVICILKTVMSIRENERVSVLHGVSTSNNSVAPNNYSNNATQKSNTSNTSDIYSSSFLQYYDQLSIQHQGQQQATPNRKVDCEEESEEEKSVSSSNRSSGHQEVQYYSTIVETTPSHTKWFANLKPKTKDYSLFCMTFRRQICFAFLGWMIPLLSFVLCATINIRFQVWPYYNHDQDYHKSIIIANWSLDIYKNIIYFLLETSTILVRLVVYWYIVKVFSKTVFAENSQNAVKKRQEQRRITKQLLYYTIPFVVCGTMLIVCRVGIGIYYAISVKENGWENASTGTYPIVIKVLLGMHSILFPLRGFFDAFVYFVLSNWFMSKLTSMATFFKTRVWKIVSDVVMPLATHFFLLFIFFFFLSFISCQPECHECLDRNKVWCSIRQVCVSKPSDCFPQFSEFNSTLKEIYDQRNETDFPFRVQYFLSKSQKLVYQNQIPLHCHHGIIFQQDQCWDASVAHSSILRNHVSDVGNLNSPFWFQAILNFTILDPSRIDLSRFSDGRFNAALGLGLAFAEQPTETITLQQPSHFFSYRYHVSHEDSPANVDIPNEAPYHGLIVWKDMNIQGRLGMYRDTFVYLLPVMLPKKNASDPFEKLVTQMQCIFLPNPSSMRQHGVWEGVFNGPHLWYGAPILTLAIILTTVLFIVLGPKFVPAHKGVVDEGVRHFFSKYAKKSKYSLKEILESLFFAPTANLIDKIGTDIYFYLWFQRYLIVYCAVCTVIGMVVLLPIYITSTDYSEFYKDISVTTVASIQIRFHPKSLTILLITLLFPVLGFVFIYKVRELARILVKGNKNFGSLYTVMVSNIPTEMKDRKTLYKYFAERYGAENIVDAHLCLDLRHLQKLEDQKEVYETLFTKYQQKYDKTGVIPKIRVGSKICGAKVNALDYYTQKLEELKPVIAEARKLSNIESTSYGFVTFQTVELAEKCVKEHQVKICGIHIPQWIFDPLWDFSCEKAPESDDILYNNLGYGKVTRFIRSIVTNVIILTSLFFVYLISFLVSWYNTWRFQNISELLTWADHQGSIFIFQSLFDLVPDMASSIQGTFGTIMHAGTNFEKHHTKPSYRKSILHKGTFFAFLNMFIISHIPTYWTGIVKILLWADEPFNNYMYYYNNVTTGTMFLVVLLCSIAKGVELGFQFLGMLLEYIRKKKILRPSFDYEGAYGFRICLLIMMLLYGPLMPILFPFLLLFFIFQYFLEKFFLMYLYQKSSDSDGTIMKEVADIISTLFGIYPLFILVMLPSTLLMWQSYLIFIPAIIGISIGLGILRKISNRKLKKRIIISASQEEEEEVMEVDDQPLSDEEINELEQQQQEKEQEIAKEHEFPIDDNSLFDTPQQQQLSGGEEDETKSMLPHQSTLSLTDAEFMEENPKKGWKWTGHTLRRFAIAFKRQLLGDERILTVEEISQLQVDKKQLAAKYQHPLLRRYKAKVQAPAAWEQYKKA